MGCVVPGNMKYLPLPQSPDARTVQRVRAEKAGMPLATATASCEGGLARKHGGMCKAG